MNDWSVSGSATVGTLALTGSGSLAANSSTTATGTYHAPTIAGPISNITQGSPVTGTISVTVNSTDTGVTPSPGSSSVTVNVGAASAPSSSAFSGGTLSGDVSNGASYTGLASVVTSGSGNLGTVAELLGGTNNSGATQTVTMAWRTRAPGEIPGTTTEPPMSNANKAGFLVSDVVQLAGTGTGNYVLEMSYDSSLLGGPAGEQTTAQDGWLFLATLHGGTWENAVAPTGATPTFVLGAYNPSADFHLGYYGVDLTNHAAWAVVDFDGVFAVVPEPGTFALLLAGAVAVLPIVRRRLKRGQAAVETGPQPPGS